MNKRIKLISILNVKGFTLLEIMIAMTVLSMIVLILFTSLHTANKYWQIGENHSGKNDEIRLVSHFIRKQISQAVPLIWIDTKERTLLFSGKEDELGFTAQLPAHRGGGGLYFLTMHIIETESSKELGLHYSLIQSEHFPLDDIDSDEIDYVSLIDNIDTVSFSYFGKEELNQESQWYDRWTSKRFMPKLIRITLNTSGSEREWPEINIPVKNTHATNLPEFLIVSSS